MDTKLINATKLNYAQFEVLRSQDAHRTLFSNFFKNFDAHHEEQLETRKKFKFVFNVTKREKLVN